MIDNMVTMMEKYSSQLEERVADRTTELAEEKKKTEQLLEKMLPKYEFHQLLKHNDLRKI